MVSSTQAAQSESRPFYIVTPGLERKVSNFIGLYQTFCKSNMMVLGPTGVGKSLFLKIYEMMFSKESKELKKVRPIIKANCAHFGGENSDPNIARSELFGHVKGAYQNALKDSTGLVHEANGGLLILDELGELPKEVQAMLLTFIETGEFRRVGSRKTDNAVVRIVGATNRPEALRQDFSYRFYPFHIDGFSQRRYDILCYLYVKYPQLASRLSGGDVFDLITYNWPGNVREIDRVAQLLSVNYNPEYTIESSDRNVIKIRSFLKSAITSRLADYGGDIKEFYELMEAYGLNIHDKSPFFKNVDGDASNLIKLEHPSLNEEIFNSNPIYIMKSRVKEFDTAFMALIGFCSLFGQDYKSKDNILENILNVSSVRYPPEPFPDDEKVLRRAIMMSLKEVRYDGDSTMNMLEFWNKLEDVKNNVTESKRSNNFTEVGLCGIGKLPQKELLKRYYEDQLKLSKGNIRRAARTANIKYTTYRSSLKRLGISFGRTENVL